MDDVPAEKGTLAEINTSGTSIRETQSILLERIASEMNRLKFYVSHSEVSFCSLKLFIFVFKEFVNM